ncbi:hypothetical protein SVAN01_04806 [Stagonosporopsis vannaccii]|nr:hypothetical protein SVAN01_04806 [Stagonosporopsis vannaccii]
MKFLTIVPIAAFFGSLVTGIPVSDPKSAIMPLTFGQVCVVCETMPRVIRESCYSHCHAVTKAWAANNTVVANNTVSASVARSALPVASNATLTTSLDLTAFSADAVGLCSFCNNYSGKLGVRCHKRCRKHAPTKVSTAMKEVTTVRPAPIGIDGLWNFCEDGCAAHHCYGPYLGTCLNKCHLCFAIDVQEYFHPLPEWPNWNTHGNDHFDPTACFCPAVEFGDRWQDDQDRYQDAIDEELAHDDDYSDDDRTDAENDW